MKTERRHELQTNALADKLAHWIQAAKPYSKAALAGVVAIVVVLFSWGFLSAQSNRRLEEGWNDYFNAIGSPDPGSSLTDVAERFAGTAVGETARLTLADLKLDNGTNGLLVDRTRARKLLQEATETYQAVLIESNSPSARQRATFGLARAHEALGALEKAREEYRSIAKQWPDSPYVTNAEQRAADLEKADTKSFYDWLARYEPAKPLSNEPGKPGVRPSFLHDPAEPNGLKLPSVLDDKSAPEAGADAAAPEGAAPAATSETPSAEAPAAEAPAAESAPAATTEKPAESSDPPPAPPAEPAAEAPQP